MRGRGRQDGQVVLLALLTVAVAGAAWEALATAWDLTRTRLTVQAGLEAGATTGSAVMADALNSLAVSNAALLALGASALLGAGENAVWVARIQRMQDELIRHTPATAEKVAVGTAVSMGAWAQLKRAPGERWPRLMVRRVFFLPLLFGNRFPLWIADDVRPVNGQRWGDRVIRLQGWRLAERWGLRIPLRSCAAAAAARPGGGRSSLPMLSPSYDSRLIPCAGGDRR